MRANSSSSSETINCDTAINWPFTHSRAPLNDVHNDVAAKVVAGCNDVCGDAAMPQPSHDAVRIPTAQPRRVGVDNNHNINTGQ